MSREETNRPTGEPGENAYGTKSQSTANTSVTCSHFVRKYRKGSDSQWQDFRGHSSTTHGEQGSHGGSNFMSQDEQLRETSKSMNNTQEKLET